MYFIFKKKLSLCNKKLKLINLNIFNYGLRLKVVDNLSIVDSYL